MIEAKTFAKKILNFKIRVSTKLNEWFEGSLPFCIRNWTVLNNVIYM